MLRIVGKIFIILGLILNASGRRIKPFEIGKQLFLSRRVVTETAEFDGGILVDEKGIIESVLTRESVDTLLSGSRESLKVFDGGNLALMAGAIDSHVHVNEPGRTSWEGFVTATQAAAVGGFTTIVDMPLNSIPPTTTVENLKIKASAAKEEIFVDVAFWGGAIPGNEDEYSRMIEAGVVGFKGYLIDSGVTEFPYLETEDIRPLFDALNGTDVVLAFHCELNDSNYKDNYNRNGYYSDPRLYDTYLATRPDQLELDAVSLIAKYIEQYNIHVHVVHVSAQGVIPILEEAREKRIQSGSTLWRGGVTAETCHHYLTISSEQIPPGHTEYKCSPPIRNQTNKDKLWQYIKENRFDLIASDHSPSVSSLKGPNFLTAWGGISSIQFGVSLFWTEAKARGFKLSTLSRYLSSGPAMLTGLRTKGMLKPGYDADLIYFDPEASFVVTPEIITYKNKISPYMYRVLQGTVVHTFLRGQLIATGGEIVNDPQGELLLNEDLVFD
ncbi:allantoinase-like [Zerene cesonia]|uniref:allantoinase-like n=1 Tax=Zerene cesonia TaxID=33412 RepID=UPI0018E55956|nr:allantoinase-like [Zerene cesonia]